MEYMEGEGMVETFETGNEKKGGRGGRRKQMAEYFKKRGIDPLFLSMVRRKCQRR